MSIFSLIFVCIAGFVAAFVDSIAGGGGLISVPAYLLIGLPPTMVNGTNKFSATSASLTSSIKFIKSKKADYRVLKFALPFTVIGAIIGVNTALSIPESFLKTIITVLIIFIGFYTYFSKSLGIKENFKGYTVLNIIFSCILALFIGFYDGFFGPGTGTFLTFGLITIFGYDFTRASGTARVMNFTSNIVSLILYAVNSRIMYTYGIPVAIFAIIGANLGTRFALKNGSKFIKPIFIIIALATAIKMIVEIF
ncbi:TSUP family transporter [Sedimentibacter sp. zth1]|uniref:sulfite exporter TauE/SafE family protein n=1 Tax=Sedimentibacter sp. zth1 TaxID=2816908 RepID=UPI001A917AAC|nr:TSUP family transporter [Sedimentibacter sp. zth1]QSX05075.1 TSUP family transporter [Sedimentibacter sp. zth1]